MVDLNFQTDPARREPSSLRRSMWSFLIIQTQVRVVTTLVLEPAPRARSLWCKDSRASPTNEQIEILMNTTSKLIRRGYKLLVTCGNLLQSPLLLVLRVYWSLPRKLFALRLASHWL